MNFAADEVHGAGWFSLADVMELDTFPSVRAISRSLLADPASITA